MTTINQLSAVDSVTGADQVPIYSSSNGDARKASMTVIAEFIQTLITSTDDLLTQYAAPSASPFTVAIEDGPDSVWLILTPTGVMANGTITLPAVANCVDKQQVLCNTTQAVTNLIVSGNGATVTGEPSTLAQDAFFRMRFDGVTQGWYRTG